MDYTIFLRRMQEKKQGRLRQASVKQLMERILSDTLHLLSPYTGCDHPTCDIEWCAEAPPYIRSTRSNWHNKQKGLPLFSSLGSPETDL